MNNHWQTGPWLSSYDVRRDIRSDLVAGLTVAVMLVPQSMAYAMLAGLPPIMGLYASTLPLVAYLVFGTSRQLAVGPVAMDSLLVATGVSLVATPGSPHYVAAAIVLAAMVGLIQTGMGLARLGFLVNFLSAPVISGFTSAAAIVIGLSQVQHLLGIASERSSTLVGLLHALVPQLSHAHLPTVAFGIAAVALISLIKRWFPRVPGALTAVGIATLLSWLVGAETRGVNVVGSVPSGLPSLGWHALSMQDVQTLAPTAVMIALVAFMEAISVAKAMASKHRYEVDANRELIGLGASNLAAFLVGGYPVTGGLSRSAVNDQAGARSPLASLFTAGFIALSLLFLTPSFYHLPKAVLAAIVLAAVAGLIDFREPIRLWRVRRSDSALLMFTFVATLFVGIAQGILLGVLASLGAFIQRSTRPHTAVLGRLPGSDVFRNVKNFPEAAPIEGVLILRMDATFYFANVAFFKDYLERLLRETAAPIHTVVIDASSINDLDSSAERALCETTSKLRGSGIDIRFANVKGPVRQVMKRSGLWNLLGDDHIHLDLALAIDAITEAQRKGGPTSATSGDGPGRSARDEEANRAQADSRSSATATASAKASGV